MHNVKKEEMSDKDILEETLRIVLDNGWLSEKKMPSFKEWIVDIDGYTDCGDSWSEIRQLYKGSSDYGRTEFEWHSDLEILFNHDFAKILWGTSDICATCGQNVNHKEYWCDFPSSVQRWEYHLRLMVLIVDLRKYLRDNMANNEEKNKKDILA